MLAEKLMDIMLPECVDCVRVVCCDNAALLSHLNMSCFFASSFLLWLTRAMPSLLSLSLLLGVAVDAGKFSTPPNHIAYSFRFRLNFTFFILIDGIRATEQQPDAYTIHTHLVPSDIYFHHLSCFTPICIIMCIYVAMCISTYIICVVIVMLW